MKEHFRIGCSGYYYPAWKNKFYPEGLAQKNWLAHYSSVFNTVELNGTFYRTPTLVALQKQAAATPDDFKFSVKMSKYITHVLRLKNSVESTLEFQQLIRSGLGEKLANFLFQMPPSFHYNEENLELILSAIPHASENVVEFRHTSWWNDTVQKEFKKAGLTFCNVDFPGMDTHMISIGSLFYLRLHGKPQLFKSSYSQAQLENFFSQVPANARQCYIYFNNTFYDAGYKNALQLIGIIKNDKH